MNVVLGVSGSIAAYRAADLARDLMRDGCDVRVCLTDAAQNFVTPALFEALTGNVTLIDTFEEPVRGRMAHIDLARWADTILIAPATANTISKLAHGIGEDMLTTLVLATTAPLVIAPAMNPQMYADDAIQQALKLLSARAASIIEPSEGDVACGEHGQGKLAPNSRIRDAVLEVGRRSQKLTGKKVLITSGPTQEPLDSVRFLSNRSSGKMGAALARAALLMGAEVTVVTGPVAVSYPLQAKVIRVTTAAQMLEACRASVAACDLMIGAAAVADYRPAAPATTKIRRTNEPIHLELTPNQDIVAALAIENPKMATVGFAAEPSTDLQEVRAKLDKKSLLAIAANDVSNPAIGFDSDENELTLVTRAHDAQRSGRRSKLGCALWLLEQVTELMP